MTEITERLTIDELARRVGMTVRNVRAYQSRGLIPPPELDGRTGYYGNGHVQRLEHIKDLQAEGFNLEAIRRILDSSAMSTADAVDLTRALLTPFGDERPLVVDTATLRERWGDQLTPELAERALELGLVRQLGDDRWEIRSARLERASRELAALDVPFERALDIVATIKFHSEAVAGEFVQLFLEQVWRPYQEAGEPDEGMARVREALERLRPLAGESLLAVFELVMTDAVERATQKELARIAEADGDAERPEQSRRRRTRGRSRRSHSRSRPRG